MVSVLLSALLPWWCGVDVMLAPCSRCAWRLLGWCGPWGLGSFSQIWNVKRGREVSASTRPTTRTVP